MKALRPLFALVGALVLFVAVPAWAQRAAQPPEEAPTSTPKDIYTRAKLHTELGSLYFQSGNLIVALEELTIAISINSNYAPAYSTRGLVLFHIKEWESADKDFRRALDIDEKDPEIANNYGWFLCETGKAKEAIPYFQRAIKNSLYQTPEVAFLNAGACYVKLGDIATGEDYVRRSLRLAPDNPQALLQLAKIAYLRGNYDAAKLHLDKVVRLTDSGAEALWLFLRVERRLGDKEAESSFAAQLRRKFPDSPEYQELLKGNFE
jgi:type IV pilus assembly protein PilF